MALQMALSALSYDANCLQTSCTDCELSGGLQPNHVRTPAITATQWFYYM